MLQRIEALHPEDVFLPLSSRPKPGVYFLRLCEGGGPAMDYLWRFHEEARARGVILEDRIPNPDERQLSYYADILGNDFQPTGAFVLSALKKWMPRMSGQNQKEFTDALISRFTELKKAGKSDSILKNIYTKMMCWLYYRFDRMVPFLGDANPPKVLYFGSGVTAHELVFLRIVSAMGADLLMVEPAGDEAYLKQDPGSAFSQKLTFPQGSPFPADFSLKQFRKERAAAAARPQVSPGSRPTAPVSGFSGRAGGPAPAFPARPSAPARPAIPSPTTPASPSGRPGVPVRTPPAGRPAAPMPQPPVRRNPAPAAPRPIDVESRFTPPARSACANAWMERPELNEVLKPPVVRGDDHHLYYTAFLRLAGVQDKLTYTNEIYQLYQQLTANRRTVVVVDGPIPKADPEELQKIRRRNYKTPEEMIVDLAGNLPSSAHVELQRELQAAFVRTMKKAAAEESNLNRLLVKAVILLCWIQRYQAPLFRGWKETDVPVFFKMGGCADDTEALYLSLLAGLPVDVIILAPNLNEVCQLKDERLLEIQGADSLPTMPFPKQKGSVQMRTVASHAEGDLDSLLFSGSGLYRNQQFSRAEAITLQTTYDEIFLLWEQELKYRPNFSTTDQLVSLPILYAKVSGVENGKVPPYWQKIKSLADSGDTILYKQFPIVSSGVPNPFQSLAVKAIKNGRLKKDVIQSSRNYPFALLREEIQEHMLEKIQLMLDERIIKGTFVNGTEYTVLATALNLNRDVLRLIQGFDFTKKNPKLIVINTRDQAASLEDAILLTFLSLIGFDVVIFVPTGYMTIERFLADRLPVEHQIGEYIYDLSVPDFSLLPSGKGHSWLSNINQIWKRGN